MFKKNYFKLLLSICFTLILFSCSSVPDIYEYQRPGDIEECYEIIVDVKDNYDLNMFLLREEKLDGVDVKKVYEPARKLITSWDKSVKLLGIYLDNENELNRKKLYDSIDDLKLKQRDFLTVSNMILGMDMVQ
jgi:hypothetical protein